MAFSLFSLRACQSFSTISLQVFFSLPPGLLLPLHIPYISSPTHCFLFAVIVIVTHSGGLFSYSSSRSCSTWNWVEIGVAAYASFRRPLHEINRDQLTMCKHVGDNWWLHTSVNSWFVITVLMPSVLWRCWLGGRNDIQPVKRWVVGYWHGYLSGARCRFAYGPADTTATHCLLLQ